jgi:hypothetical protein
MAVKREMNVTTKIMANNKITEQVNSSNYLGYTIQ